MAESGASRIIPVDETNILQAAAIHSISWKESHRAFCTPDFIEKHTPDRQREYLLSKMNDGTRVFMLVDEEPVGVVSITDNLIEDLYVLPVLYPDDEIRRPGHSQRMIPSSSLFHQRNSRFASRNLQNGCF